MLRRIYSPEQVSDSDESSIAKLMKLVEDVDEDLAQAALDRSDGDLEQAADLLLTGFKKVTEEDVQPLLNSELHNETPNDIPLIDS